VNVTIGVTEVAPAARDDRLWGAHLDAPRVDDQSRDGAVEVVGWVLGRQAPAVRVEFVSGDVVVGSTAANVRRPDLKDAFPDASERDGGGFRAQLNLLGDAEEGLDIVAVLRDDTRVPVARIVARPRWRGDADAAGMSLVSVVIPCHNHAAFLQEAIDSVLAQTYPHFEIVVVDDGSTDNTAEVAGHHAGVQLVQQERRGLPAARNAGLRASTGELVVFLDADDRLKPQALEAGLRALRAHPQCAFVSGQVELTHGDGSLMRAARHRIVDHDHYRMLLQGNIVLSHATALFRRQALEVVGGFDESLEACEDYDLYLRISRRFPVYTHDECVAEYRRHGSNMHRDPGRMLVGALRALRKQRKEARRTDADHAAYELGLAHWRREFGGQLVDDLRDRLAGRRLDRETRRRLRVLARWYPAGLRQLRSGRPRMGAPALGRVRTGSPRLGRVRWGHLRRLDPIGVDFGFERGTPVDRHYIEGFLERHADDVRGRVLEVGDAGYTRRFGNGAVTSSDVIHLSRDNEQATIVADLATADDIPDASFDCVIVTETLQMVYDVRAAVATLHRILRPGGVVLATFPGLTLIDDSDTWCWGFTVISARRLFGEAFGEENVDVEARGNVLAATAFLHGIAAEELTLAEIDHPDPNYPMSIHVRAAGGGRPSGWWQSEVPRA
jgi:hypothetical protein